MVYKCSALIILNEFDTNWKVDNKMPAVVVSNKIDIKHLMTNSQINNANQISASKTLEH